MRKKQEKVAQMTENSNSSKLQKKSDNSKTYEMHKKWGWKLVQNVQKPQQIFVKV